jgi:DNA-directed RNA polymerase alpha subunit
MKFKEGEHYWATRKFDRKRFVVQCGRGPSGAVCLYQCGADFDEDIDDYRDFAGPIVDPSPEPELNGSDPTILDADISTLGLSVRADNVLRTNGINTIGRLARLSGDGILVMRNAGGSTLNEIETKLAGIGLKLVPYRQGTTSSP